MHNQAACRDFTNNVLQIMTAAASLGQAKLYKGCAALAVEPENGQARRMDSRQPASRERLCRGRYRMAAKRFGRANENRGNHARPAPAGRIAYVDGRYLPHGSASVHVEDRGLQFADSDL